jgi:hypothetical protein
MISRSGSSSDKAKLQYYCDSKKVYQQMGAAYQKNDSQTADALNKKADVLASKIGPEYPKLMDGLEQVDHPHNRRTRALGRGRLEVH